MNPQALTPTIPVPLAVAPDTAPDTAPSGLRPAPGRVTPLPEYFSTTDRDALPANLNWTNDCARPPINCRVDVIRFGIYLGSGTVTGYFHRKNQELGVLVALDNVAEHLDLIPGTTKTHFYGENIRRLDQGDEPVEEQDEEQDEQDEEQKEEAVATEPLVPLAAVPLAAVPVDAVPVAVFERRPEPLPELQRQPLPAPAKSAGTDDFNLDSQ